MGRKGIIALSCLIVLMGVSQAQCYGRIRNINHGHRDPYICTCEDLLSLISLTRNLEEKETVSPPSHHVGYPSNFEELIMKLVNALVYTTTQVTQHKCHCTHSSGSSNGHDNGSSNNGHSSSGSSTSSNSHSGGGLIDLGLLNSNNKNNVLDLDLGGSHLLGLGLGGNDYNNGGRQRPYNNGGRHDDSGINLDLLNSNKNNNVADLDIGRQTVLGVGLGGDGGNRNSKENSGAGLVNLDLLNPNREGNVVDLDLNKQHVLGVGLGD